MRLFKGMFVLAGVLDLAMFLQSPSSLPSSNSPVQTVGLYADNSGRPLPLTQR
jgi:hypothetical protein